MLEAVAMGLSLSPGPAPFLLLDAATPDPTSPLLQYGAIGVFAIICIIAVRELYKRQSVSYDREVARADKAEQELAALNTFIRGELVPLLTRATDAVTQATERRGDRGPS